MIKIGDKLYRYYNEQDGNNITRLRCNEFLVIELTAFGYWYIHTMYSFKPGEESDERLRIFKERHAKWGHKHAKRPYAYPDKQQALKSFIARKKKHIEYCQRDARNAYSALKEAQRKMKRYET